MVRVIEQAIKDHSGVGETIGNYLRMTQEVKMGDNSTCYNTFGHWQADCGPSCAEYTNA